MGSPEITSPGRAEDGGATSGPMLAIERVEGPSFPPLVRLLATVLVAGLASAGWRAGDELRTAGLSGGAMAFLAAAGLMIAATWWGIQRSRTVIDGDGLSQRGMLWPKHIRHADITQVKLVQIPGLSWLVVPRLVVRTRGIGVASFPAGNAALLQAFRSLAYGGAGSRAR